MRALLLAAIAATLIAPVASSARAQTVPAAIVTVDQDRLFAESMFGQRVQRDHEARVQALSQENRQIEATLIDEERALTEQRDSLPADEFRALADAFDDKVQRIRAEQDAKAAVLGQLLDDDRQAFLRLIGPILQALTIERGAVVLLDRRTVILAADSIDITAAAVARIDNGIGEGTADDGASPIPQPEPAPRPNQDDPDTINGDSDVQGSSIDLDAATDDQSAPVPQPTE